MSEDRSSTIGAQAIAVLGIALLGDAAIETVSAGSPVRWWAVGAAAVYLLTAALTWRTRMAWRGRLGIIGVVALGLLAATVWRPDGLTNGVRLAGQPTAIVLSGATVLALLVALLVLFRATIVPLAARLVAALLAIYGIAAFAFGAWQATAYPALFAGASLWQAAPRWVQGAIVGGLVVLPIALLASLAGGLQRGERRWHPRQVTILALAVATVLAGFAGSLESNGVGGAALSVVARTSGSDAAGGQSQSGSHNPDGIATVVRAQAARLGKDPAGLLTWVASNIKNDVYAGVLRGARGTLAARAGNAVDKALLLRDLIRASDPTVQVRFASCTLPADQVAQLVGSVRTSRLPRQRMAIEAADEIAARSRNAEVRAVLERAARLWQTSIADARTETARLVNLLDEMNVRPSPSSAANARAQSVSSRHFWVQSLDSGTWTDLDPTLSPGTRGNSRCKPETLFAELPPDQYDSLTIKIRIEERRDGALKSRYALERSWRITDVADANITFMYAEPAGVDLAASATQAPKGARAYTPVLRVGDEYSAGQPFFLPVPASAAASPLGAPAANAVSGIGSIFGHPNEPKTQSAVQSSPPSLEPDVTGSWLEVTMSAADGWHETVESPLFDRIGYAARVSGLLSGAPPAPLAEADGEYVPLSAISTVAVWTGVVVPDAADPRTKRSATISDVPDLASFVDALGRMHRLYYRLRRALFDSVEIPESGRVVALRPSISLLTATFDPGTQRGGLSMDVASDHSQSLGEDRSSGTVPAAAWAVSSVLGERLLVDGSFVLAGQPAPGSTDAIAVFAAARQEQVPFQILRSVDGAGIQGMHVSVEARARLVSRLAQGSTVILPARMPSGIAPPSFGWWLISPHDGSIRDEMENGRHGQATGEYSTTNEPPRRSAPRWQRLGQCVAFVVAMIPPVLGAYAGGEGAEGSEQMGEEVIMQQYERPKRAEEVADEIDEGLKGKGKCR